MITHSKKCFFSWILAEVTVQSATNPWQLIFEGIRGTGDLGKLAIDDVRITRGACPAPGDCSFEGWSYCTYTNDENGDLDWLLWYAASPNYPNGN